MAGLWTLLNRCRRLPVCSQMKTPAEPHRRRMVRLVVGSWRYPCRPHGLLVGWKRLSRSSRLSQGGEEEL